MLMFCNHHYGVIIVLVCYLVVIVIYKGSIILLQLCTNDCEYLAFSIVHTEVAVYHTLK